MAIKLAKYKICSQNRINLWESQKLEGFKHKKWSWAFNKRNKRTIFSSAFFIQHRKSLRFLYKGVLRLSVLLRLSRSKINRKQFTTLFSKFRNKTPSFFLFLNRLNTRLDFILYNSNLLNSIFKIRQIILHGGVMINGKKCISPNIFLQEGDIIQITPKLKYTLYKELYNDQVLRKPLCPYLEVNYNTLTCAVLSTNRQNKSSVPYEVENNQLYLMNFLNR